MGTRSGSKDTANYGLIGIYKGSGCQHALIWLYTLLPGMNTAVVASGRGQTRGHAGPKLKGLPIGGHSHTGQWQMERPGLGLQAAEGALDVSLFSCGCTPCGHAHFIEGQWWGSGLGACGCTAGGASYSVVLQLQKAGHNLGLQAAAGSLAVGLLSYGPTLSPRHDTVVRAWWGSGKGHVGAKLEDYRWDWYGWPVTEGKACYTPKSSWGKPWCQYIHPWLHTIPSTHKCWGGGKQWVSGWWHTGT